MPRSSGSARKGGLRNWTDPKEMQFACLIYESEHQAVYLMLNAGAEAAAFDVPPMPNDARWRLAIDTCHEAPQVAGVSNRPALQRHTPDAMNGQFPTREK